MTWQDRLRQSRALQHFAELVRAGGAVSAKGVCGSSAVVVASALHSLLEQPLMFVTAHLDDADEALDELTSMGYRAARFPAMEIMPGETTINVELIAERLMLLRLMCAGSQPDVIVAPIQALMQMAPVPDSLESLLRVMSTGDRVDIDEFTTWLTDAGYERVESIESPGEFAVRGGILDVFPPGRLPARVDLFGDEVESIAEVDLSTMGSDRRLDQLEVVPADAQRILGAQNHDTLMAYLARNTVAVIVEVIDLVEQGRSYFDRAHDSTGIVGPPEVFKALTACCHSVVDMNQFSAGAAEDRVIELPVETLEDFPEGVKDAMEQLSQLSREHETYVVTQNEGEQQRLMELITEYVPEGAVRVDATYLHRGFIWVDDNDDRPPLALVPYNDVFNRVQTRRRIRTLSGGRTTDMFLEIEPGDFVVHRDHGIARFVGLESRKDKSTGRAEEYLTLEFAKRAKLHLPASKIELVQKYVGGFHGKPELSVLGGKKWARQKDKVREAVQDMAGEMLRIQAARESQAGIRYPDDTTWQREFEAEFPYEETEDQRTAIAATKRDMAGQRPMDRLICGDVGFGKTEVAIRAAFKAAEFGKQVAVLVPTTVLAEQHERTFRQRFADYPFKIASISRFKTKKEQQGILQELRAGRVDIIVGTHRLLSQDVHFADLGLVIVDEEQRFGVEHKQRLLEFRLTADVLTLSATPIPRTLHMAMLGLRDISSLSTAPLDRRAIVTDVIGYNARRIKQAIERELAREGQVFFVHNRVYNIKSIADDVQRLAPDARVIIGHGQMSSRELETVMLKFVRRQADILVCTTIIESGIDIPTANTMLINDAHMFGLSELHQLRGRVGRYKHRAYCYLLLPQDKVLSDIAVKRLRAIENFSMLGAGFKIALQDLEIRGAGNLLGAEQSGHIAAVGYEMYCQLLDEAVRNLKNERREIVIDTTVDIGIVGTVPRGYIPSERRRLAAYRRISQAQSLTELKQVEDDLVSAYGELPRGAQTLFDLIAIRIGAARRGIRSIRLQEQDVIFRTTNPRELEACMQGAQGSLRPVGSPDAEGFMEVYFRPPASYMEQDTLITVLRRRLAQGTHASVSIAV